MPASGDLKNVLARLRERYLAMSGNTIAAFAQLAKSLQAEPASAEVVEALRRALHRVHGTAGSYGFLEASRLAAALEPVAVQWAGNPELDRERRASIVGQFVRSLSAALGGGSAANGGALHRLLLVEIPEATATGLVAEALHRGYHVELTTAGGVGAAFDAPPPTVVISGAHLALSMPEGVPLIVLRTAGGVVARNPGARLLEASTDPRELLVIAESLAVRTGLAGVTLLVVEDSPAMSDLLRVFGEAHGMFVETRPDATDIEATIDSIQPALLLLDIDLPGVSGLAVTRQLRAAGRFADLPVVLVSASTDVEARTAADAAGADDFQSKPVAADELITRIARLLGVGRQRQLSRGIHPASGIWLADRAHRAFDERLAAAAATGSPMALAVLRPLEPTDGTPRASRWHREVRRVANALFDVGVEAGFRDESSVMLLIGGEPTEVIARLGRMADASREAGLPWVAGVADTRPGADLGTHRLARQAEEAWTLARDQAETVRRWSVADAGVAPDIIVVEDDAALTDLITFALEARGLTWVSFGTGPEALDGLRAMRVHRRTPIVLLDVDSPGLDGFSLFERLRVECAGMFRAVIVSVHASEADQLRALRAGALDCLAKPLSLRVLMAKIASWPMTKPAAWRAGAG